MDLKDRLSAALTGRYEIEREIGRGGMAVVFLARDLKLKRRIAIKVLRPEFTASLVADRFVQEIQIAARLEHPHILALHESDSSDGLLWYAMPYVQDETLQQKIEREKQLAVGEAVRITCEVAEALSYAHAHGVIHRDIKPANILFSDGHPLVADFGIAKAFTEAGGPTHTATAVGIGTPGYMSPEQATGEKNIDPRTDIYSLACVLYEMLAGETPYTGPTAQAIIAKQLSLPVQSVRTVRETVSPALDGVLCRALAKVAADRFPTVAEFAAAIQSAAAAAQPNGGSRRTRRIWVAAASAAVLGGVFAALRPGMFFAGDVDPAAHVMAQFGRDSAPAYLLLEHELYSALRQVPDITLVESLRVNDQILRRGGEASDLGSWLDLARALGAGRLVVPRVVEAEGSLDVIVEVYDVRRGRAIRHAEVAVGRNLADLAPQAARLTERLFGLPDGVLRSSVSAVDAATRAFVSGMTALRTWDLAAAGTYLREAIRHEPDYAQAHFWSAQVGAWSRKPSDEWINSARRAVIGADRLGDDKERGLAAALLAMAERRFPQACAQYDSLIAADSTSFDAWFGLGECHARDDIVIPDPSSPSSWRWRSSLHTAANAYERALELVSSFAFAFQPSVRLANILHVETYSLRRGRPLPPDTGLFAAYPSLMGDTIGFIPYPSSAFTTAPPPPSSLEAVRRQRQQLRRMARAWVRAFPDSSQANYEVARALELLGELDGSDRVESSAMAAARRARRTARNTADSVEAVVLEARLLVKLGRWAEARERASEALSTWPDPEPRQAWYLASLAALIGKVHEAARLGVIGTRAIQGSQFYADVPLPILEASEGRLLPYASLGAPAESIAAIASRIDTLLQVHTDPGGAGRLRCRPLRMPLAYAFPVLRRVSANPECRQGIPFMEMQWALTLGDSTEVLAAFRREVDRRRPGVLPGDLAIDYVYHEAWLLLQVGDTVTALQHLDTHLAALRAYRRTIVLAEPQETAALIRAMALRAELAAQRGDPVTAAHWAEPVASLWRDTDDREIRGLVERMRMMPRLGPRRR